VVSNVLGAFVLYSGVRWQAGSVKSPSGQSGFRFGEGSAPGESLGSAENVDDS